MPCNFTEGKNNKLEVENSAQITSRFSPALAFARADLNLTVAERCNMLFQCLTKLMLAKVFYEMNHMLPAQNN